MDVERDYGGQGNRQSSGRSGGDALPWIMAALTGFYAWSKTRDTTTSAIAAIGVGVLAKNKYGRMVCIAAILWFIYQMVFAAA